MIPRPQTKEGAMFRAIREAMQLLGELEEELWGLVAVLRQRELLLKRRGELLNELATTRERPTRR